LNVTNLRIQALSCRCGTAPCIEVAALLSNIFWNSFNLWPEPSAESQLNWIYFILSAMAPYGVVSQLLALVQCQARVTLVHDCHDDDGGSPTSTEDAGVCPGLARTLGGA
jgi:hypothetical protein